MFKAATFETRMSNTAMYGNSCLFSRELTSE
jgi:hypothetical protein